MPDDRLETEQILAPRQTICVGCGKLPSELAEFVEAAAEANEVMDLVQCSECLAMPGESHLSFCSQYLTPDQYVEQEEGTLNPENGHFLCTACYIAAGMPARRAPDHWVAP